MTRRRMVDLAAPVSLLLCVAVAALWVRSYWVGATLVRGSDCLHLNPSYENHSLQRRIAVRLRSGRVSIVSDGLLYGVLPWRAWRAEQSDPGHDTYAVRAAIERGQSSSLAALVRLRTFTANGQTTFSSYGVPAWLVGLLPALFHLLLWLRRLWPTFPAGPCQSCGYELRKRPQRCPECGTVVTAATKTA